MSQLYPVEFSLFQLLWSSYNVVSSSLQISDYMYYILWKCLSRLSFVFLNAE